MIAAILLAAQARAWDLTTIQVDGRVEAAPIRDFTGDGAKDLAVVGINYDVDPPRRWIQFHVRPPRGGYPAEPSQIVELPPTATVIHVGKFLESSAAQIGFMAHDGVYVYQAAGGRIDPAPVKLIHTRTFFDRPSETSLPIWSWGDDLTGDGRSELLVPVPDGLRVYVQTAPGLFGRCFRLESDIPAESAHLRVLSPRHWISTTWREPLSGTSNRVLLRPVIRDLRGNDMPDLVFFDGRTIVEYSQTAPGQFRTDRGRPIELRALTDVDQGDQVDTYTADLQDVDHDGNMDLIVARTRGRPGFVESIKTRISIHFGDGYGQFMPTYYHFELGGVSVFPEFVDVDGDGALDMSCTRFRTDLAGLSEGLSGELPITHLVFLFNPRERQFEPGHEVRVSITVDQAQKRGFDQPMLVLFRADFNGDRRVDQLEFVPQDDIAFLRMFAGQSQPGRVQFAGRAFFEARLEKGLPQNVYTEEDLNEDGTPDVMLFYGNAVGLLMSRR